MLRGAEFYYLATIVVVIFVIIASNFFHKDPLRLWSPMTMVSVIILYYGVVGPLLAIANEDTFYRLIDHRSYFQDSWEVLLLGVCSTLLGFNLITTYRGEDEFVDGAGQDQKDDVNYLLFGKRFLGVSLICIFLIVGSGGLISQVQVVNSVQGSMLAGEGIFRNYLMHTVDLLIGAACLMAIAKLRDKENVWWLVFIVAFSIAVFLKQGFRWRVVVLAISVYATYHIYLKKKVNLIPVIALVLFGVFFMGFIQNTRNYGAGLSLEKIEGSSQEEIFLSGLEESAVFMTTGLLVDKVNETDLSIGLDPVLQSIFMPIPRVLWPGKPSGEYIDHIRNLYNYININNGTGAAVLNFGEHFLMFGYIGVFVMNLIWGVVYKRLWNWFLRRKDHPLTVVAYTVFFGFIFVIISRGYMPQVFMLFMFSVYPFILLANYNYKKYHSGLMESE